MPPTCCGAPVRSICRKNASADGTTMPLTLASLWHHLLAEPGRHPPVQPRSKRADGGRDAQPAGNPDLGAVVGDAIDQGACDVICGHRARALAVVRPAASAEETGVD